MRGERSLLNEGKKTMWGDLTGIRREGDDCVWGRRNIIWGVRRVEEGDKGHRRSGRRQIAKGRGSG